jgi:predicted Zn-dependent peptidase
MTEIYRRNNPDGPDVIGYYLPGMTITLGILVGAGAALEPRGQSGVSHVVSRAIFERTRSRSHRSLRLALEESGLQKDSALNPEWTRYWVRGLADDLPRALPLLAECVLSPVLDDAETSAAKARARGQLLKRREQRELYVNDMLRTGAFGRHVLGSPTLGTAAGIDHLGTEDIQAFHGLHYRPGDMVLAVAGQFDWREVLDLVDVSLPRAAAHRARRMERANFAGTRAGELQQIPHQHVGVALPGPAYGDPLFYTWAVITHILGWGFSSRLFQTVRERLGLAYSVAARMIAHSCAGYVLLYGTTTPQQAGAFVAAVRETVRTLAERGVSPEELAAAKVQLASELVMRGESTAARMHTALTSAFFEDDVRGIEQIQAAIEGVRADDVDQALSAWRCEPALGLATVGPIPVEELFSHAEPTLQPA